MATITSFEHKPFVDSEVGLKLETFKIGLSSIGNSNSKELVVENGRNIIKAGAVCKTNGVFGIVYNDIDYTDLDDDEIWGSVMTGGYFVIENLADPAAASSNVVSTMAGKGLFSRPLKTTTRSPITDWEGINEEEA